MLDGTQKGVAILTSGGDAPGMNAAVRSCVAVCLAKRVKVFSIQYGYKGESQWRGAGGSGGGGGRRYRDE